MRRSGHTNVVRHSAARTCRISVAGGDDTSVLEIVDDGRGLVAGEPGIGLTGVADRLHALGGTFEAGTGENGGFRLRAGLGPLNRATSAAREAGVGR